MNFSKHTSIQLFRLAFIMLLFPLSSFSQRTTQITLVDANSLEVSNTIEGGVKRLIGDVVLEHEGTYLYCDSAYLYTDSNSVKAYSNVRITSSSVTINGKLLLYNGNTKIAEIFHDVKMTDGKMTLTTDHLTYSTDSNTGNYTTGGKVTDVETKLTSQIGYYYSDNKQFFFKKNVVLVKPQYTMHSDTLMYNTGTDISYFYGPTTIVSKENTIYCENGWYDTNKDIAQFNKNAILQSKTQWLKGDSLYYDKKKGFGKAFNNITAYDTVQKITMKGNYAEYKEKEGTTMMTKEALLIQNISGDSLFLHADTLKAYFDTAGTQQGKTLFAYNHAKFYKTDLQGMADSLVYSFKDSMITMYIRPVMWTDKNQLTADTMVIHLSKNQIKQMNLYTSSFIVIQDDSTRFNQVKGKNLIGHFVENKLKVVDVRGNGETIYYVRDDKNKMIGVNKAISDNLLIHVDDNKIKTITFISKPEAVLYPEKDLSANDVKLKDFKWEDNERPLDRDDIFQ